MTAYRENDYKPEEPMLKPIQNPDSENTKYVRIVARSVFLSLFTIVGALFVGSLYSDPCGLERAREEVRVKEAEATRAMFESMTNPRKVDGGVP